MNEPKTYEAAQAELQQLLTELQEPSVPISSLTEKVARARTLVEWSKARLRTTEAELDKLLSVDSAEQ